MLVRLAYLAVSNAFTASRLLPLSGREKDIEIEILTLRHQISVLQPARSYRAPGRYGASHRRVGGAGRTQPRHGPRGAGATVRYLIRDRDAKLPALLGEVLAGAGIAVVLNEIRMPRMNAVMQRWVRICRRELLDRTLIWKQAHLLHALREFECHDNEHRPHRALRQAAPLHPIPEPVTEQARAIHLDMRRRDRLGGSCTSTGHIVRPKCPKLTRRINVRESKNPVHAMHARVVCSRWGRFGVVHPESAGGCSCKAGRISEA